MLVEEQGPFDIFEKLRDRTRRLPYINLDCLPCISVVIALVFWLSFSCGFYEALAISAVAVTLDNINERLNHVVQ